jgi:tRNA/tmRNA/rRNA uracil-C5-methylase (TrmA/RlmC/RlmD family)
VALARTVGPSGSVVAVERSGPAVADLGRNCAGLDGVEIVRAGVTPALVGTRLGRPDLVVLDPARAGAGKDLMAALLALEPAPRRLAYVSCEPAPFARDLAVAFGAGWRLASLRAFDLFPMTEHVELVAVLEPPVH